MSHCEDRHALGDCVYCDAARLVSMDPEQVAHAALSGLIDRSTWEGYTWLRNVLSAEPGLRHLVARPSCPDALRFADLMADEELARLIYGDSSPAEVMHALLAIADVVYTDPRVD